MQKEIRWHYRFNNFSRAVNRLREALESETLTELEREGVIQRFEYTFELAWKLLKDRLEHDGIKIPIVTPRGIIKESAAAKLIKDGDAWLDMLDARNNTSHNYNSEEFEKTMDGISFNYISLLENLHKKLGEELKKT